MLALGRVSPDREFYTIAGLVQMVEIILAKISPALYQALASSFLDYYQLLCAWSLARG